MKKLDYKEIGYYGKPINSLTKVELLDALLEVAAIIYECSAKAKKLEKSIFIKKIESINFNNSKKQNSRVALEVRNSVI